MEGSIGVISIQILFLHILSHSLLENEDSSSISSSVQKACYSCACSQSIFVVDNLINHDLLN
jgi:hypothetical protein